MLCSDADFMKAKGMFMQKDSLWSEKNIVKIIIFCQAKNPPIIFSFKCNCAERKLFIGYHISIL